ncbi:TNF receptor-associated factor 2 [Microcaecilia unicolor]|uniref:TNF receptor-associated factor n=1 Tax=Microcaecilia unicolor TaxID=1415580 RepID=A0A6P7XCB7_9AMPH|nr:TNF receptor-associated factor 2-like [Microcaecilia unicolor]
MVALATSLLPVDLTVGTGLLCSSCGFLLLQPTQTECGHRYCAGCVTKLLRNGKEAVCSVCQERLSPKQFYRDRAAENDTLVTEVRCPNTGCSWTGMLKLYLESHQSECSCAATEPCPNSALGCNFTAADEKSLGMHLTEECSWRMMSCPRCAASVSFSLLQDHFCSVSEKMDVFPCYPLNSRSTKVKSEGSLLESGYKTENQVRASISCPFQEAGCQTESQKESLKDHLEENQQAHLLQLLSQTLGLQSRLDKVEETNSNFKQLVMEKMVMLTGLVSQDLKNWDREGDLRETKNGDLMLAVSKKTEQLENTVSGFNKDLDKCAGALEALQQRCLEYEQIIQDLQVKNRSLESQLRAGGSVGPASTNGILVWKIENISGQLRAAKVEQRTSFYSPVFSTHPFGYHLCCRIYPNGDGSGRGSHLSLFLAIVKGDYDDILPWPFRQKVTLMLVDQSGQQKHFRETFIPDTLSASFHKPKTHMNVASGSPQFIKHSLLLGTVSPYLKNNAIYIKVIVDSTGLEL